MTEETHDISFVENALKEVAEGTVDFVEVDNKFLSLQDWYRSYEKELNQMKAEIKEEVNKQNQQRTDDYQVLIDKYYADHRVYNNTLIDLRNKFNKWKISENERISQLKIVMPKDLNGIESEICRTII